MRVLLQRVSRASVTIPAENYSRSIGPGMVLFVGIRGEDTLEIARSMAAKIARFRIFEDGEGKMNLSLLDTGGAVLAISQFTLYADTKKGNRPGFSISAEPGFAKQIYLSFVEELKRELGRSKVEEGIFGTDMKVEIHNDGPVTFLLEKETEK